MRLTDEDCARAAFWNGVKIMFFPAILGSVIAGGVAGWNYAHYPEDRLLIELTRPYYPEGKCLEYASTISKKLSEKGYHGRCIFYQWRNSETGDKGSHVLTTYTSDRRQFATDNEHQDPVDVPYGAGDLQIIFLFGADKPAPIEITLNEGLNHLSHF
jgi:hypothetical protein